MLARRVLWLAGATAVLLFCLFIGRPLVGADQASAAALSGTGRPSVNVYIGPSGMQLSGTATDGGGYVPNTSYAGPWATAAGSCVLCSTPGDGGTLTTAVGTRYLVSVVDSNGSPATATENGPCVAYASAGLTISANSGVPYRGPSNSADGGAPYLTCCAQTATESPAGPYLCASPLQ